MFSNYMRYGSLFFIITLLFSNVFALAPHEIGVHEYYTDLFKIDPVVIEYFSYSLLRDKLIEQVNYLAIPGAVLINRGELRKIPNIKLEGGFALDNNSAIG